MRLGAAAHIWISATDPACAACGAGMVLMLQPRTPCRPWGWRSTTSAAATPTTRRRSPPGRSRSARAWPPAAARRGWPRAR
ncbi:MAG: hypothetical protein WDM92_03780 [Caulobacteraceae bacterium]